MGKAIAARITAMPAMTRIGCVGQQVFSEVDGVESRQLAQNEPGWGASSTVSDSSPARPHAYSTREIWVDNAGAQIYGVAYVPDGSERAPLVVFAHELGNDYKAGIPYAEVLASRGYAVYTFDFRGGSVNENRSDGATTSMSVMTEVSDLAAVVDAAKGWDFVDPTRFAVLGGSQGGCVAAAYASAHPGNIAGLLLLYPAFSIYDELHARFLSLDEVPDTFGLFGNWMTVGRNYATDIWGYDPFDYLGDYAGRTLIVHGDADSLVDLAYSQRAASVFHDCDLHVIKGAGHRFSGEAFDEACEFISDYLDDELDIDGRL